MLLFVLTKLDFRHLFATFCKQFQLFDAHVIRLTSFRESDPATVYSMDISAEKTKLMTYSTSDFNIQIKVNEQKLETVTNFKYLGSVTTEEGSKPEILSRIAQTTAALTRLKPVWNDRSNSLSSKIRLMRSFVKFIFLYACE